MSDTRHIKKDITYTSIYNVLVIIIPLVITPYISRTMGVEAIGIYSFSNAVALYFRRTALLGVEKFGNREIALARSDDAEKGSTFWNVYSVQLLVSTVCMAAYCIYAFVIKNKEAAALCQGLYVLSGMFEVHWYFFGKERFRTAVIVSAVGKLLYMAGVFAFVRTPEDVNIYIILSASGHLIPNCILLMLAAKNERFSLPDRRILLRNLKGMLILFVPVIAVTLYKSMDKLMLGMMLSTKYESGLYENAEKLIAVPAAVISAVGTVMMPRMTKLYQRNDAKNTDRYMSTTFLFVGFISVAFAFGMASVAEDFSLIYWGENFAGCAVLIPLFSVTIPFMSFAEVIRTQYLIPKRKDRYYIISVCLGAAGNVIVNALLIPILGGVGAVIGTIFAEAIVCTAQVLPVRKEIPAVKYILQYMKFLVPGMIMYFSVRGVGRLTACSVTGLVLQVVCGVAVYTVSVLALFMLFDRDNTKELVRHLVRR